MNFCQRISLLFFALLIPGAHGSDADALDKWGRPRLPPGMVRLDEKCGMPDKYNSYSDKYFTVYDVSTNKFAATPAWKPSSLEPIPLPFHQAYAIYMEWRKTCLADKPWYKNGDRITLCDEAVAKGYHYTKERRWFYTIEYGLLGIGRQEQVIVLLDGTLVAPRVIDLRTEAEKKEYEEKQARNREYW